jgi:hypothetical protein
MYVKACLSTTNTDDEWCPRCYDNDAAPRRPGGAAQRKVSIFFFCSLFLLVLTYIWKGLPVLIFTNSNTDDASMTNGVYDATKFLTLEDLSEPDGSTSRLDTKMSKSGELLPRWSGQYFVC